MAKDKYAYVCQECGYDSPKWLGQCPNCKTWNSMVEEKIVKTSSSRATSRGQTKGVKPQKISKVQTANLPRTRTKIEELNRVLGGGVVPGSLVLIGGDPGIGKSTLLLQLSAELSRQGQEVLYVTGEESDSQVKMRAERLDVLDSDFYIYPETDLDAIKAAIESTQAAFVVIDSIQTITHPEVESSAGSVSQVRESTAELMRLAKSQQIAIFLVGHVTKQGNIAGPRILEHMVDTVLYFEGDQNYSYRMLRAVKNRYGSTNEIGVFEMRESGLKEVTNPSQLFLEERLEGSSGSAVVVSMEGTRPILAEIQALVTPTAFGNARRTASGVDYNRVTLIMAVLEKRAGLLLQNQDAYVKASGGVRLNEPAIDLAIAVSLASSYRDKQTHAEDCFIGELGLTGEVRRVNRIEQRVQEAAKLGFKRVFIPYHNLEGWDYPNNIHVVGVRTLKDALKQAF